MFVYNIFLKSEYFIRAIRFQAVIAARLGGK